MNEEILDLLRREIGPLGIRMNAELIDHVYYLNVDGSSTYPVEQYWDEKWGKTFSQVIAMFLKYSLHKVVNDDDIERLGPSKIRIRLGTVFDFVKEVS